MSCSWDNPGANRYSGNVPAAVQSYSDIPKPIRDALQRRMEKRQFDEVVEITRDKIVGKHEYSNLRDMHFGKNTICASVSRSKWKDGAVERALIYCEQDHCIAVPTICGNVSRITRKVREEPQPLIFETAAGTTPPPPPPTYLGGQSFIGGVDPISVDVFPFSGIQLTPPEPKKPEIYFPPYTPPTPVPPPPLPAVPEIPTWLMFIVGAAVLAARRLLRDGKQ